MLHIDAKSLKAKADAEFSRKLPVDRRNQAIADNFYVERADFTTVRSVGEEFADHLMSGYPQMVRRDLGDMFGSMLRPKSQQWMHVTTSREDKIDLEGKRWLEWATQLQRRAMYDRISGFARATKLGDHDLAAFGATAISVELNERDNALYYRNWHLRDVAWEEDKYGEVGSRYLKWVPSVAELKQCEGKLNVHEKVKATKDEAAKVRCMRIIVRADEYDWKKSRHPWVELWIDCDNEHIMSERGSWTAIITIPRWALGAGHYPVSPATVIALPDGRLLQAMTLSMLDLSERAANPPMIGVAEAIRGDLNLLPGGFTAVDAEYDERLGEVMRPLVQDKTGINFGLQMLGETREQLKEAFYLNTLTMPELGGGPQMTAFEVGQRVQEYIRRALPIFEPIESDYNGGLCEMTFETLMRNGAFGAPDGIPKSIQGADIDFKFEGPLSEMVEKQKGNKFLEAKAMISEAVALDPGVANIPDFGTALRDVLDGIGVPAKWMRSEEETQAAEAKQAQMAEGAALLEQMEKGAGVAQTLVQTSNELGQGGLQ